MSSTNLCCAVWMVTYNHEHFIARALESALSQKVNFSYKIFIGDDCSTDKTSEICRSYAEKYPDKIELLVYPENIGAHNNGVETYYRSFQSGARYIALLEGDDAWLDEEKLQKQVDFLETHPEYAGCFHNTEERYENDDLNASFLYCNFPTARSISFENLSIGNIVPTCSIVFRNNPAFRFPDWYFELKMGDWPLHLLNTSNGDYWYIPKVMGIHRLHKNSVWMLQDADRINQYITEAFDIMIRGFSDNPAYVQSLSAGKEAFLKQIRENARTAPAQWRGYKRKAKNLMIRMINKL
jgi:glycosyltransferase involved in cell wall biosynthesis